MGRLETERKSERGREAERKNDGQRGKWATEGRRQARGWQRTHPDCISLPWLAESDWISAFAGLWHPFTLGSTGSTPPSSLPLPFPSVRPGWAVGRKPQHSLCTPQAEERQLLWYPPRSSRHKLSVCFPRSDHQKLLNLWMLCEEERTEEPEGDSSSTNHILSKNSSSLWSELLDAVRLLKRCFAHVEANASKQARHMGPKTVVTSPQRPRCKQFQIRPSYVTPARRTMWKLYVSSDL